MFIGLYCLLLSNKTFAKTIKLEKIGLGGDFLWLLGAFADCHDLGDYADGERYWEFSFVGVSYHGWNVTFVLFSAGFHEAIGLF